MIQPAATVFLIEDDASVRKSLVRLLRASGYIVEAFAEPHDFLQRGPATGPCCAVVDVHLPGLNGLELQKRLAAAGSFVPLIFITGNGDVPTSVRAIKAGAIDFLLKPFTSGSLLRAVEEALARSGRTWRHDADHATLRQRAECLTGREREVFRHVVSGAPNKRIAGELGISEQTVKIHRGRVMRKMGARSLAELVQLATALDVALTPHRSISDKNPPSARAR